MFHFQWHFGATQSFTYADRLKNIKKNCLRKRMWVMEKWENNDQIKAIQKYLHKNVYLEQKQKQKQSKRKVFGINNIKTMAKHKRNTKIVQNKTKTKNVVGICYTIQCLHKICSNCAFHLPTDNIPYRWVTYWIYLSFIWIFYFRLFNFLLYNLFMFYTLTIKKCKILFLFFYWKFEEVKNE